MLLALDEISRSYGTDPLTVMGWTPERLGFALMCIEQRKGTEAQLCQRIMGGGGMVFPVAIVGR